jgi:hypothetical protein
LNPKAAAPLTHELLARKGPAAAARWRNEADGANPPTAGQFNPDALPHPQAQSEGWRFRSFGSGGRFVAIALLVGLAAGVGSYFLLARQAPETAGPTVAKSALPSDSRNETAPVRETAVAAPATEGLMPASGPQEKPVTPLVPRAENAETARAATPTVPTPPVAAPLPAAAERDADKVAMAPAPKAESIETIKPTAPRNNAAIQPPSPPKPESIAKSEIAAKPETVAQPQSAAKTEALTNPAPVAKPVPPAPVAAPATTAAASPIAVGSASTKPVDRRPAQPPAAETRPFSIQLASLKDPGAAEREVERLQSRYGTVLDGMPVTLEKAEIASRGVFYRIKAGAFEISNQASAVCKALKAKKQPCLVVRR